jgi:agmatine deiminase
MISMRFHNGLTAAATTALLASTAATTLASPYVMPDEADTHSATWVSYVARHNIWGNSLSTGVKRNLEMIVKTIAKYEPVNVLVNPGDYRRARQVFANEPSVTLYQQRLNDLWVRDYGAVFVLDNTGDMAGISLNFNGWGSKQAHWMDKRVAKKMTWEAWAYPLNTFLVMEGGGIETDGHGTAILTESCILNKNRNPGVTKAQAERELKRLLGLDKILWLPGIKGKDITDGHVDFYVKFVKPGVIVVAWDDDEESWDYQVTRDHYNILSQATDASGNSFEITKLPNPDYSKIRRSDSDTMAAGYINYYVGNGFVLMPEFGDVDADSFAQDEMKRLYPGRTIEVINIDDLAEGGGGIHCATMQQPALEN